MGPVRTNSQIVGDKGEGFVGNQINCHANWLCRTQTKDYGVDLEAELAIAIENGQELVGKLVKIQVKGKGEYEVAGNTVSVRLDRNYLDYVMQFRLPIILVLCDVSAETAWYTWLQEWVLDHEQFMASKPNQASFEIAIPVSNTLDNGLSGRLQAIARGEQPGSLVLAVRDLIAAASATGNKKLSSGAVALLESIDPLYSEYVVSKVIDALLGLGPNPGMWQTSEVIPSIIDVIRLHGDLVTTDQVVRLVARNDRYSRAGFYGLVFLYDDWREHALTLNLPETFRKLEIPELVWYTEFRSAHPEIKSLDFGFGGSQKLWSSSKLTFEGLTLPNTPEVKEFLAGKWPNRGDSAVIDSLVWERGEVPEIYRPKK